jgi:hypothetical protein
MLFTARHDARFGNLNQEKDPLELLGMITEREAQCFFELQDPEQPHTSAQAQVFLNSR